MLQFSLSQAPFRFGVEEGTDPKQVPFGTLLTAQNVVWVKSGRLQKRQGTAALTTNISGGGTISSAQRLFVRGGELGLIAGSLVYTYNGSSWVLAGNNGHLPDVGLTWESLQSGVDGVGSSDVAVMSDGNVIHAWSGGDPGVPTNGNVYYRVFNRSSGAIVTATTVAGGGGVSATHVRVLVSGTNWVVVYNHGHDIRCIVNGATPVTLRTDAANAAAFDACIIGTEFVIAYALNAGGIGLYRYSIATTPVQQASGSVTGESATTIRCISIDGASGGTLWIGYFSETGGTAFRLATANPSTLVQVLAPTDMDNTSSMTLGSVAVANISSTSCLYSTSVAGSGTSHLYAGGVTISYQVSNTGTQGDGRSMFNGRLLSRPTYFGTKAYALLGNFLNSGISTRAPQGGVFLVDITPSANVTVPRLVGKVEGLTGGNWRLSFTANMPAVSSTEFLSCTPTMTTNPEVASAGWMQSARLITMTTGASLPNDMWRSVVVGQECYLAAGVLTAFDGRQAFDYGFAYAPIINTFDSTAIASGGSVDDGAYTYSVVPEFLSRAGTTHRGQPAIAETFTVSGGSGLGSVALLVIPVHLSQKDDESLSETNPLRPLLAIYRSVADGTVLQRLTLEPTANVIIQRAPLNLNGLVDTRDDDAVYATVVPLSQRPAIYTDSGELEDHQPPSFVTICVYRNRIFGITGDRQNVWFSKNYTSNPTIAPGFHPDLRLFFNDRLTALAVLDERLFIFSETGIYYVSGDGPSPSGDPPLYPEPNKIQTDVGCTNARGVVSTPMGIMFVRGDDDASEIHLLDRKLNTQWIGKPVQDLLDAYPNVTSAVLVASKNHVRFSCQAADGLTGIVLVYDYQESQWSHFVYGASLPIADACMHDGVYTFVTTAGVVYKESDATWLDAGSWVTAKIETAWIHGAGPIAYQAVRNFQIDGVCATAHGLSISVGFDGNDTYQQGPATFASGTSGVTSPGLQRARVSIGTRRKCGSIRFKVEDSASSPVGTGQGAKWSSMAIEVGINNGTRRLPATQTG